MTAFRSAQANFCRGELGPQLYGRFDVDAWGTALRRARNVIVLKYGGLTKRPGTQLVAEVLDADHPVRLIPFQFSLDQTYALEMGQGYMSPCALGGRIVEDELAITAVSNESQALVEVALHGLVAGDGFYVAGCAGEIGALLNGRTWTVTEVIDADHFRLAADTSALAPFSGCEGGTTRTVAPSVADPVMVTEVVAVTSRPSVYYGGGGSFGKGAWN